MLYLWCCRTALGKHGGTCDLPILQLLVWLVMLAMWWVESYHTQMRTKLG